MESSEEVSLPRSIGLFESMSGLLGTIGAYQAPWDFGRGGEFRKKGSLEVVLRYMHVGKYVCLSVCTYARSPTLARVAKPYRLRLHWKEQQRQTMGSGRPYMYVYMYVYIHVQLCALCTCMYIHVYIRLYKRVCTRLIESVYVYVLMYIDLHMYMHMRMNMHMHVHLYI